MLIEKRRIYWSRAGYFIIKLPKHLNNIWSVLSRMRQEVSIHIEAPEDVMSKIRNSLTTRDMNRVSRWDKGLDFSKTRNYLVSSIKSSTRPERCYDIILLIQLVNGARVSEAVRGFKKYIETGSMYVEVPLSKRKRPETRTILIPEVVEEYAEECYDLVEVSDEKLVARVKNHALRKHGFNTHSLRVAFIVHQLKQGVDPRKLARILTGHKRLDHVLRLLGSVERGKGSSKQS